MATDATRPGAWAVPDPAVAALLAAWLTRADAARVQARRAGLARFLPAPPAGPVTWSAWVADGDRLTLEARGPHAPRARLDGVGPGRIVITFDRAGDGRASLTRALGPDDRAWRSAAAALIARALRDPGDRWVHPDLAGRLEHALAATLGGAALAGPLPEEVRHGVLGAARALTAALHADQPWPASPRPPAPDRLVLHRRLLPDLDLPGAAPAELPVPAPDLVDTDALPPDQADAVRAAAPPADITLLRCDAHTAAAHLDAGGLIADAALTDPPYASSSPALAYRDGWPAGGWEALLREHLEDLARLLRPGGVALLHTGEHRGAALELLAAATPGLDLLGLGIWDKRNPRGDALGLAGQHERLVWLCRGRDVLARAGGLTRRKDGAERVLERARALCQGGVTPAAQAALRAWLDAQSELSEGVRAYRCLDDQGRVYRPVSMAWPNKQTPPAPYFEPLLHPVTGKACPVPARGWRNPPDTMARLRAEGAILFGPDETTQPTRRYLLADVLRERVPSVWYHAGSDDPLQADLGLSFPYAKPVALTRALLDAVAPAPGSVVLDLFAGSGTTAHAALEAQRLTGVARRVVLAERDPAICDGVLLQRLIRVMASETWASGRPTGAARQACLRVVRLA